jgi:transglutaminase-like putative cysteine protease
MEIGGAWRSLVAHLYGVQGVAGSNPVAPISNFFCFAALFAIAFAAFFAYPIAHSETVEITGVMNSSVNFEDDISITVPAAIRTLTVAIPTPTNTQVFGYTQTLGIVSVVSSRPPDQTHTDTDRLGNKYTVDDFKNPAPGSITFTVTVTPVKIEVDLQTPLPSAEVDPHTLPSDIAEYLKPTDLVQCDDPQIAAVAQQFLVGTLDEATVASRIQEYLQRTISYNAGNGDAPDDALYVLRHKNSLCDGWAHLFLALARADGLAARFVGGYNLGGDINYPIDQGGRSTLTVSSAGEPHSWVEVWFPTVGWVPFEPQASAGFVDSHHLTVWVGADSDSVNSILSWTSSLAGDENIPVTETENPTQLSDHINVTYRDSDAGPAGFTTLARRSQLGAGGDSKL